MSRSTASWFGILLILLVLPGMLSAQEDAKIRTWKSRQGQHSIQARWVAFDPLTEIVILETEQGTSLEVELSKLSLSDQKWTRTQYDRNSGTESNPFDPSLVERGRQAGSKTDREREEATAQDIARSAKQALRKASRNQETLFGIRWTPQMNDALTLAEGSAKLRDDRPVMWFRALGNLSGFM